MKIDLKIVLDDIRSDESSEINPVLLYPYLQKANYLSKDEVSMIKDAIDETARLVQIFELLKEKDDKVFIVLQKFCHMYNTDLFHLIQRKLKEIGRDNLIWQHLGKRKVPFNVEPNLADKLKTAQLNLKSHYEHDFELIEIQWQKFNVTDALETDVFYNQDIIIEDKNKELKTKIENFDQLFSTKWKRMIITADAGYGKSTFVHEMVRQWVRGQSEWTEKFLFVFLFRLSEISKNETISLQSLLTMCLNTKYSSAVSHWLKDFEHNEKCLFVFDGLDELRQEFCEEIDNLLFGRGVKLANVILTSRPSKKLDKFDDVFSNNLYIELKGYTEEGANRQVAKFEINPEKIGNKLRDVLKVPLFNTLFCITHKEGTIGCLNICAVIEKFVNFACSRHRKANSNFTAIQEDELQVMLGRAAQNKFSLMKGVNIGYPNVTTQQLSTAISIGLVSKKSTKEDLVFAHQTIAEYCAAYFWIKKSRLKVEDVKHEQYVYFAEGGSVDSSKLFSCFLCHLKSEYKQFLWQNFKVYVPLMDEYDSLPKRTLENEWGLILQFVPVSEQNTVMDKIEILNKTTEDDPLILECANFESGKKFENITTMKHLMLQHCSFKISPEEFFCFYNIKYLHMEHCTFNDFNPAGESFKDLWMNDLVLENLCMAFCDIRVVKFLSFIVTHCTTLKTFELWRSFESEMEREEATEMEKVCNFNYFGEGWISDLQNNEKLILSIEQFELTSDDPIDLTILFETLGRMVNLKKLILRVQERNLTKTEINSLKLSFENGLKKLEKLKFDLKNENGITPEFFLSANINNLDLHQCTFNEHNPFGADLKEIWKKDIVLEKLHVWSCDFTVVKFLSFIMSHCTTLKTFKLENLFESEMKRQKMIEMKSGCNFNYFGEGWISELQNNEKLILSIERFQLFSKDPIDLTILFETLGKMINLKQLKLTVRKRTLTKAEINSLKLSFEKGLKKLETLDLYFIDEEGNDIFVNNFQKFLFHFQ